NNPPLLGRPIRLRRSEFVEGLSSFFVNGKPVIRSWFWDRLNSGASVENVRRRTGDNPPRSPTAAPLTSGRGGSKAMLTSGAKIIAAVFLLTASTPVIAVQPLAKERNRIHALTASVAPGTGGGGSTGCGWPPLVKARTSPITIALRRTPQIRPPGNRMSYQFA